jgi:hypothetical protein
MTAIAVRAEPEARAKMVSVIRGASTGQAINGGAINHSFTHGRQNEEAGGISLPASTWRKRCRQIIFTSWR